MWNKIKCWFGFHELEPYGEIQFYKKESSGLVYEKSKPMYKCKYCGIKAFKR